MKSYQVQIKETLAMIVTVEAENAAQARWIAERQYKDGEHILDESHYQGVVFTIPRDRDYER